MSDKTQKPMFVYDGDCSFCQYCVDYLQKSTGSEVNYQPYQLVGQDYPHISTAEFKAAVQYIAPDQTVSSGAKASFQALAHAPQGGIWLTLYRKLPGFAYCTEKIYHVVSTHRPFFYKICRLFWGKHPEPPRYDLITWLFLRLFGLIFLSAFFSFATQALGLIGSRGIVPVATLVTNAKTVLGSSAVLQLPMLFWLNSSDLFIQSVAWSGVIISVLLIFNILPRLSLFMLYILYLTLSVGGQVFMTFQWDMLLLEAALIAIVLVRYRTLGVWLMRWLVFRFILGSGLVKILSGDPSWWDMTALNYHFLTQPLPTPLAWYAYYLPAFILKTLTLAALIIELVLPFFIFCPRRLRFFAGICIVLMQIGILLTGNYNFFNLTTLVLCLTLFDDAALRSILPAAITKHCQQRISSSKTFALTPYFAGAFAVLTVIISLSQLNHRYLGFSPLIFTHAEQVIAPYGIVNTYGPFAVMTKKRYEIVIEGSNDGLNWSTYQFKYKPGPLNKPLSWNIPLQPRLDWQMWFAALGPPEASPWFAMFLQRLLENSPDVLALLANNPFPDLPPMLIRANFYDYTFTNSEEYRATGNWWKRERVGMYVQPVSLR